MATKKTRYICNGCGYSTPKWFGKCVECGIFNSAEEELATPAEAVVKVKNQRAFTNINSKFERLSDVEESRDHRVFSGISELDRVLGGGFVEGSVILLGGSPGIGKSTILLQAASALSQQEKSFSNHAENKEKRKNKFIYLSGEESSTQVKMRGKRLQVPMDNIFMFSEVELEKILAKIEDEKPDFMIIDSIQTLYSAAMSSAAGGVSQIKECASQLTRVAKERGITIIMICHVNKDGDLAGPKALEHIVDTVLSFEGDENSQYRMLRAVKNRYGEVNEIGMFAMGERGLESVNDPTGLLLSSENKMAGSAIYVSQEGSRSILVEIQALLDVTNQPNPSRSSIGVSRDRLNMLCAIINKFLELPTSIYSQNVFLTLIGGMKFSDTGVDVPALLSMISSANQVALPTKSFSFGEIGLTNELRIVSNMESRIREAARMGLKIGFVPKTKDDRLQELATKLGIKVYESATLKDLLQYVFMTDHGNSVSSVSKPDGKPKKSGVKVKSEEQIENTQAAKAAKLQNEANSYGGNNSYQKKQRRGFSQ